MSDGTVVFERRIGALRLIGLSLLALAAPASLWALVRWERPVLDALAPMSEAFGKWPVLGVVIAVSVAPTAAFLLTVGVLSRRFGRCVAGPDWLVFERALVPAWIGRSVALRSELRDREPRADLVRVWLQGTRKTLPLIVPARTQAELEAALLELDRAVDDEPVAAGRRHGQRDRWIEVAATLTMSGFAVATMLVLGRRLGEPWMMPSFLGLMSFVIPLMLCLSAARAPRIRRVYVGRLGLAVGEELFTWDELTCVGVGEGYLACAADSRTCIAFVGADEGKVRDAIAARLVAAGRLVEDLLGPLPSSEAGWRRRARRLIQAAPAVLVPVGALIAASVAPNYEVVGRFDPGGPKLYLIHAHDEDRPAVVVLVTSNQQPRAFRTAGWWPQRLSDEPGASSVLDLPPGATFVHISPQGMVTSRPEWSASVGRVLAMRSLSLTIAVPEHLEQLAEGVNDETVRAAIAALRRSE